MHQLNYKEVLTKAKEYYDKGMLTAQHPDPDSRVCRNSVGMYRCAVAACYPDDVINAFDGSVETGVTLGFLAMPEDLNEWARIVRLQLLHDTWAVAARGFPSEGMTRRLQEIFEHVVTSKIFLN